MASKLEEIKAIEYFCACYLSLEQPASSVEFDVSNPDYHLAKKLFDATPHSKEIEQSEQSINLQLALLRESHHVLLAQLKHRQMILHTLIDQSQRQAPDDFVHRVVNYQAGLITKLESIVSAAPFDKMSALYEQREVDLQAHDERLYHLKRQGIIGGILIGALVATVLVTAFILWQPVVYLAVINSVIACTASLYCGYQIGKSWNNYKIMSAVTQRVTHTDQTNTALDHEIDHYIQPHTGEKLSQCTDRVPFDALQAAKQNASRLVQLSAIFQSQAEQGVYALENEREQFAKRDVQLRRLG